MILTTVAHKLQVARYLAAKDATLGTELDLTTEGDWANKPAEDLSNTYLGAFDVSKSITSEIKVNGLAFSFIGTGGANKGFKYKIFTWRSENGCAHQVAEGTGTLGTQAVVTYPHNGATVAGAYWADTLTVTWYNWYKRVDSTDTTGHNTHAEVWLDAGGARDWYIEIDDPDSGDAATLVGAYFGYF
ncbi:MAG: hypothetical protein GY832_11590 [Chloroflexi bacterium]|nr:hypothetical protein [Chloroflexota bacterium]